MTDSTVLGLVNGAFYQIMVLVLPLLGTAMIVGLIISIFQATTSIQEQTLTFVPKLIAVGLLLLFIGPFYINSMTDYTTRLFNLIASASM